MCTRNSTIIIPANTGQIFFTEDWFTGSILIINLTPTITNLEKIKKKIKGCTLKLFTFSESCIWTEEFLGKSCHQTKTPDVWLTVHCNSIWIRNQLDVTFVLSFISPLQVDQHFSGNHVPIFRSWQLRSVIASCWYCAVAAGRLSEPVSR